MLLPIFSHSDLPLMITGCEGKRNSHNAGRPTSAAPPIAALRLRYIGALPRSVPVRGAWSAFYGAGFPGRNSSSMCAPFTAALPSPLNFADGKSAPHASGALRQPVGNPPVRRKPDPLQENIYFLLAPQFVRVWFEKTTNPADYCPPARFAPAQGNLEGSGFNFRQSFQPA